MAITKDATKGWARPANASEWTELLAGTGIGNPQSSWDCTEGSGNLADDIGSLTLTAGTTPLYAQAASGWSGTGVAADDNTSDRFVAAAATGPDPSTTSQVWLYVMHIGTEPTAGRVWGGINMGSATLCCRLQFAPSAGTNKLRINVVGTSTDGAADYAVGDYVIAVRYDRAASVAKAYSNLETVTGTYSSTVADGNKGFGQSAPGDCQIFLMAMWSGAAAEALDDSAIATIISLIQSPPGGLIEEDYVPPVSPRAPRPARTPATPASSADERITAAGSFPRDFDYRPPTFVARPRPPNAPIAPDDGLAIDLPEFDDDYAPGLIRAPARWARSRVPIDDSIPTTVTPPVVTPPPGPTLAAMQAGSFVGKWVLALEGYPYLLTDADEPGHVVTAWAGTDFADAVPLQGLFVSAEIEQRINPWDPFTSGGSIVFSVQPTGTTDEGDTFGIDVHRSRAGAETFLEAGVDNNDTTLTVTSAVSFDLAGSGYAGTEAFSYTSKTATTLTGVTRGLWSPFPATGSEVDRFAHQHRVNLDPNGVRIAPLVTAQPRSWLGKWVGLWQHVYSPANGLLNVKADALCTFAGRVVEIRDNANTDCTDVECEHVLDYLKRIVLGKDLYTARMKEGMFLATGVEINMRDTNNASATWFTANPLTVVAGTPASVNEIKTGFYTASELCSILNAWLASEFNAGRLSGEYIFNIYSPPGGGSRTGISWRIAGVGPQVIFHLIVPRDVSKFLGDFPPGQTGPNNTVYVTGLGSNNTIEEMYSLGPPLRNMSLVGTNSGFGLALEYGSGTFVDQRSSLPTELQSVMAAYPGDVGCFRIVNGELDLKVVAVKSGDLLSAILPIPSLGTFDASFTDDWTYTIDDERGQLEIKQFLMVQGTTAELIKRLLYSTGTNGYNHPTFDVLPFMMACAIPGSLLGDNFIDSVDALPAADAISIVVLDKPKKLVDLIGGDLALRWAFFRWREGGIQLWSWSTPISGPVLDDSSKASPVGTEDDHRSVSILSDDWRRSLIRIEFNREIGDGADGSYRDSITIEDRTAIDDAGGEARGVTIKAPNTWASYWGTGVGIDNLLPDYLAVASLFTRPVRRLSRSIDSRYAEGYSVGDVVLVTDRYARDPDTGRRGVSLRPAIIVRHRFNPGGPQPDGTTTDMGGEVELMLLGSLRVGPYVPTAWVSSYNAGTKQLTCFTHSHSESTEAADASSFTAGRKVRVVEIDPANPAAPLTWDDVVVSTAGDVITLTTGLAGYDAAKSYRVIFDDYPDVVADQQSYSFQADDADAMVSDLRVPYQYAVNTQLQLTWPAGGTKADPAFTLNSPSDLVELAPDSSYGDGRGLDVGTQAGINRLINNLVDYKLPLSLPSLNATAMTWSGSTVGFTWQLAAIIPIHLTQEILSTEANRSIAVAPFLRATSGTASVRVTLTKFAPDISASTNDVDRGADYEEATFTTSSATYTTPAAQNLAIGSLKTHTGNAFLLIEISATADCMGLASAQEGPRS